MQSRTFYNGGNDVRPNTSTVGFFHTTDVAIKTMLTCSISTKFGKRDYKKESDSVSVG